jgi:glutamate-1-semialdehyde 2,1-aminomutase
MPDRLKTERSRQLFEEGRHKLVGGVASALHKAEWEEYPIFIERALGSRIYDVDGNEYIDYFGAYGPMILGYCPSAVDQAVIEQIGRGSLFAAPFEQLNQLSNKLTQIIPCADLVSYACTGTEANMLNFRLARAYTGKNKIIKFEGHYHGWSDEEWISHNPPSVKMLGPRNNPWKVLSSAGQRLAALDDVIVLPWNDLDLVQQAVKRHGHEIAAIITEPVMCNAELVMPNPGYLEGLRAITGENEIVLIFDEVITGFRLALGGAQQYYGVVPDLSTFAKAVAGGYPLAGVVGKREILEAGVQPVGTFNANPIAVAASLATITELEKPGVYEHMARITRRLAEGVKEIARREGIALYSASIASIWQLQFGISEPMTDYRDTLKVDKAQYQRFRTICLERGLRFHPSRGRFYTSAAHTDEDVDRTLEIVGEVLSEMSRE